MNKSSSIYWQKLSFTFIFFLCFFFIKAQSNQDTLHWNMIELEQKTKEFVFYHEPEKAKNWATKLVQNAGQMEGTDSQLYWQSVHTLAMAEEDPTRQEYLLKTLLKKQKTHFPTDSKSKIQIYQLQGTNHLLRGNFQKADSLFHIALSAIEKEKPVNVQQKIDLLKATATSSYMLYQPLQADSLYKLSLNLVQEYFPKDTLTLLDIKLNQADLYYYDFQNPLQALAFYQECETLFTQSFDLNSPRFLENVMRTKAGCLTEIEAFDKAEALYIKMELLAGKIYDKNSLEFAGILNDAGVFYQSIKDRKKALKKFLAVLKIRLTHPSDPRLGIAYINVGVAYQDTEDYKNAASFFTKSLPIFEDIPHLYYKTIQKLGNLSHSTESYTQAAEYYKQVEINLKQINKPEDIAFGELYANMARLYLDLEQFEKATDYAQEAKQIFEKKYDKHHFNYAASLALLGMATLKTENTATALLCFNQSKNILIYQLNTHYNYLSEHQRVQFLSKISPLITSYTYFVSQVHSIYPKTTISLQNLNLQVKELALEKGKENRLTALVSKDKTLQESFEKWRIKRRGIAYVYSLSPEQRQMLGIDLDEMITACEVLEKQVLKQNTIHQTNKNQQDFISICESLKKQEVTIDFLRLPIPTTSATIKEYGYAALITRVDFKAPLMIYLDDEVNLAPFWSKSIRANSLSTYVTNAEISYELYQKIWQPLEPYLSGVTRVFISPSGGFNRLAFEVLSKDRAGEKLLLDELEINYWSNLKSKILLPPNNLENLEICLFANPDFGSQETIAFNSSNKIRGDTTRFGRIFSPLYGTEKEAKSISELFNAKNWTTKEFFGLSASEENFKNLEYENTSSILHLATHGFSFAQVILPDTISPQNMREISMTAPNPLRRSGLALANANQAWLNPKNLSEQDDGILTGYEIANMNLSKTNLVVVSACDTNGGDIDDIEGVFGLQRAFKLAGVNQLILSLWKVPDKETAELMILFYENILEGMSYSKALNEAKREMRKKYDAFYWAAFVLVG